MHLSNALIQFLSSRKHTFPNQEEENKFRQYTVIALLGQVTMLTFGVYNLSVERYLLCTVLGFCILGLCLGWLLLYKAKAQKSVYRANSLLFCFLLLYMMSIGGAEHSMILWTYISPLTIFFLVGRREGLIWISFMVLSICLYFYGPFDWENKHHYGLPFTIRFLVTYILITIITYFYENFIEVYRRELMEKNQALQVEVAERTKIQRSLRESEVRYRAIYQQAAEGILLINHDGEIVECNPKIRELLGYSQEQLLGKNITSLFHNEDIQALPSQLHNLLNGETILIERRIKTANGQYIHFEQSGRMVNHELIILLYRDITERKIAEQALEEANIALKKIAHHDGLTQIANRRKFDIELDNEWQRMKREKKHIGLILADIDLFKQYNDIYGHQQGDTCLKKVASILDTTIQRSGDMVARYGGEEFVILLPDTNLKGCWKVAQRMKNNIEAMKEEHAGSDKYGIVTVSFGLASMIPTTLTTKKILISTADNALYLSKQRDRNKISDTTNQ